MSMVQFLYSHSLEDNLFTKDKMVGPKVSFIQRLHCVLHKPNTIMYPSSALGRKLSQLKCEMATAYQASYYHHRQKCKMLFCLVLKLLATVDSLSNQATHGTNQSISFKGMASLQGLPVTFKVARIDTFTNPKL